MRADRLITLVLLLQHHQERTAQELADELTVSVRTIYRDIDALCAMGIPIYADRGPAGGYRLVEGYTSEFRGLTRDERNALQLLDFPDPLTDLAVGRHLRNALLKLAAAGTQATPHVLLDWSGVARTRVTPHLHQLYDAVIQSRRVRLGYRLWGFLAVELEVAPLGLVLSGGAWHLVCEATGRLRTFVVGELTSVAVLPDRVDRSPDFDLKACWAALPARQASVAAYAATVRVSSQVTTGLLQRHGQLVSETGADREGWRVCQVMFEDDRQALCFLLTLGGAVEVVAPEALRLTVQDYAAQILRRYGHAAADIGWPAPPPTA